MTPREASIVRASMEFLRGVPRTFAMKMHGGAYSVVGTPDVLWIVAGRAIWFEMKCPGKKLTPVQEHVRRRLRRCGCEVHVVTSVDEVRQIAKGVQNERCDSSEM